MEEFLETSWNQWNGNHPPTLLSFSVFDRRQNLTLSWPTKSWLKFQNRIYFQTYFNMFWVGIMYVLGYVYRDGNFRRHDNNIVILCQKLVMSCIAISIKLFYFKFSFWGFLWSYWQVQFRKWASNVFFC